MDEDIQQIKGMEALDTDEWRIRIRELGNQFLRLISSEKERKRIMIALGTELDGIRVRYDSLVDSLRSENITLKARLEENRRQLGEVTRTLVELGKNGGTERRKGTADKSGHQTYSGVVVGGERGAGKGVGPKEHEPARGKGKKEIERAKLTVWRQQLRRQKGWRRGPRS